MDQYTLAQYAHQVRRLLKMQPQEGDIGSANLAEQLVRKLAERAPPGSGAARQAEKLVAGVRGWFTGQYLHTPDGVKARRIELTAMTSGLEAAAQEHDDGRPR